MEKCSNPNVIANVATNRSHWYSSRVLDNIAMVGGNPGGQFSSFSEFSPKNTYDSQNPSALVLGEERTAMKSTSSYDGIRWYSIPFKVLFARFLSCQTSSRP